MHHQQLLCLRQSGNRLYVPMYDEAGKLWNIQRVSPDGTKQRKLGVTDEGLPIDLLL